MLRSPRVVLLTPDSSHVKKFNELLRDYLVLTHAPNLQELRLVLQTQDVDALLCDWFSHTMTWRDALHAVQEHDPELPLIVFSRTGGEREWVEVIEAGAFDLLVPPYNRSSVIPVMEHAITSRFGRQRQTREL